ncbi:uncharacterized protein LOC119294475 isoform X2 [Triticum dicoccoides]|nr:uncharacterized protein LOC119294475 isoform X2 [Triticum dicoccoides]
MMTFMCLCNTQPLEEFLIDCPLVYTVSIFGGEMSEAATDHGRCLFQAIMADILKNHLDNISWDGAFSIADVLIVKHEEYVNVKIQKEPVKFEGRRQLEARVKDLNRAAAVFIPLYQNSNGVLPVFFDQLKEDLEEATIELVEEKWFIKYLTYHVAFMPSAARMYFEMMLNCRNCGILRSIMLSRPVGNDWKALVKSTKGDSITLLHDVFSDSNPPTEERPDRYESTVRGLLTFIKDVLEHGKDPVEVVQIEFYLARTFPFLIPGLLRTFLQHGIMKQHFADIWSCFKVVPCSK